MNKNKFVKKESMWKILWKINIVQVTTYIVVMSSLCIGTGIAIELLVPTLSILDESNEHLNFFDDICVFAEGAFFLSSIAFVLYFAFLLLVFSCKCVQTVRIAKRITFLPMTKEELDALNIKSFNEFDKYIFENIFGINRFINPRSSIAIILKEKLEECYKLLPLPDNKSVLANKINYIDLRADRLKNKICGI